VTKMSAVATPSWLVRNCAEATSPERIRYAITAYAAAARALATITSCQLNAYWTPSVGQTARRRRRPRPPRYHPVDTVSKGDPKQRPNQPEGRSYTEKPGPPGEEPSCRRWSSTE